MKKILLLILALALCSSVYAAPLKEFIFFGDSLTDNGNFYRLAKVVPESPPYYRGRFSNGPTWAENLGNYYHSKYQIPYSIYAYGGATTLNPPSTAKDATPTFTLESELNTYYLNSPTTDKSKIVYVIWIGANDYLHDQQTEVNRLSTQVVNKIMWAVASLSEKGAKHFLILNLPDLSRTPYALSNDAAASRLHILSEAHNQKLAEAIKNFNNLAPTAKIIPLDVNQIFTELLTDTRIYNKKYKLDLTNVTQACWLGGVTRQKDNQPNHETVTKPCAQPNQYLFWDPIHPTKAIHQMLATLARTTLAKPANDLIPG